MKKILPVLFFLCFIALKGTAQDMLLDTTLEMAQIYTRAPLSFYIRGEGEVRITPADKHLGQFTVEWADGRLWSVRFGQEITLSDAYGRVLASSLESKSFFTTGTRLLNRQVTAHGVQYLDDQQQKSLTATSYFEGFYPTTADIWMKRWDGDTVSVEIAIIALTEVLRQLYSYEG